MDTAAPDALPAEVLLPELDGAPAGARAGFLGAQLDAADLAGDGLGQVAELQPPRIDSASRSASSS
jgi:hypothetical protein